MLRTAKQFQNSGSSSGAKTQGCDSGPSAGYHPWSRTRGTVLLNTQKLRKTQPAFSNQAALQMLSPSILRLQPKLTINQPGDRYEQEADRVAEDVMRTPDPKGAHSMSTAATGDQLQRKCACSGSGTECEKCKQEEGVLQRTATNGANLHTGAPAVVNDVLRGSGEPLAPETRRFMEPRFGADFSHVLIHRGPRAAESAAAVNALAYTVGNNIVFASGQYKPTSRSGEKLLAHELAHVVQQGPASPGRQTSGDGGGGNSAHITQNSPPAIQRKVAFNVLEWGGETLQKSIVPANSADKNSIALDPPTRHILISGLVEVNGDATDDCANWKFGTTQTAWQDWAVQYYWGRTAKDGHTIVRRKHLSPVRDPAASGNIWYDEKIVESPSSCGDGAGVFHIDAPWEEIPKTVTNDKTKATNYLTGYTRGLHLVTYLTGMDPSGNFLKTPLRFIYWNALHDFVFTPNFADTKAAWVWSGPGVRINIGLKGQGEAGDAPYFTTAGPTFNQQFTDDDNVIHEDYN